MQIIIGLSITLVIVFSLQATLLNTLFPKNVGLVHESFHELTKTMAGVSTQTSIREKFIEPLPFFGSMTESREHLLESAKTFGTFTIVNEYKSYMHLVFTSSFLKLNDDVEVYFDDVLKRIHIKSVARINYLDRKRNLNRYQAIKGKYLDF